MRLRRFAGFTRWKSLLFIFCSLLFGVLAACVIIELCLRGLKPILPARTQVMLEEAGRLRLNAGRMYRGTAILAPEPAQVEVAFVGDSMTFGLNVDSNRNYPARYANKANRRHVNLGVVASDPVDYIHLSDVALEYHPERLVLAVFANDFGVDLSQAASARADGDSESGLVLHDLDWSDEWVSLKERICGYSLLWGIHKMIRHPAVHRKNWPMVYKGNYYSFVDGSYWNTFLIPRFSGKRPVDALLECVGAIRNKLVFTRCALIVLLIPTREMVYGPWVDPESLNLGWKPHAEVYEEVQSRLVESGVSALNPSGDLSEKARLGAKLYFSIDGHLTEKGHEVIADFLVEQLETAD